MILSNKRKLPLLFQGFTLMEVLITVTIFLLLLVPLVNWQRDIFATNGVVRDSLVAESQARGTLKQMIKELRTMSQPPTGDYPLAAAGNNTVTFFADTTGDGINERIRYFVASTTVWRGVVAPVGQPTTYPTSTEKLSIVVVNLTNATSGIFTYYDENYDGQASSSPLQFPVTVAAVRVIKTTFQIDANPNRSPTRMTFTSQVSIRNLKDNL